MNDQTDICPFFFPLLPAIHGDKQQNERDWVLDQFKSNKSPIMVATDVASRGIGEYQHIPSHLNSSASPTSSPDPAHFLLSPPFLREKQGENKSGNVQKRSWCTLLSLV